MSLSPHASIDVPNSVMLKARDLYVTRAPVPNFVVCCRSLRVQVLCKNAADIAEAREFWRHQRTYVDVATLLFKVPPLVPNISCITESINKL